jgi:putative two-component system response regulator
MKEHVTIGGDTLDQARELAGGSYLAMAADVARYHHERYDGTGYCEGLREDAIPLAARIVALADVYDALSSARVYKPPMEPGRVRNLILAGSGTQFDPVMVDAFRARYDDILAVTDAMSLEAVAG